MQAIPQARLRLRSLFNAQEQWRPVSVLKRAQVRDLVSSFLITKDGLASHSPPLRLRRYSVCLVLSL
jgi:hypothetical protein